MIATPDWNQITRPDHIDPQHWREWLDSGVDPEIIAANVRSLSGEDPYDYLCYSDKLERTNTGRLASKWLKSFGHTESGGWWCSGLDPLNNWQPMIWGVFKPNCPRLPFEPGKKPIKYESPPKEPTRAFFLFIPNCAAEKIYQRYSVTPTAEDRARGFWHVVWKYGIPIVIVEGCKKSACLLSHGYAAIALPGVFNSYRAKDQQGNSIEPSLIPELRYFATPSREIRICFDHDLKPETIKNVNLATSRLGKLLTMSGCSVRVIELPGPEKGVDDFLQAKGHQAFTELYDAAKPLDNWNASQYNQLSYPASLTLNQKFLGQLPIPADSQLICLKSPKGSGKTESLVPIVADAIANGQWVLLIGHRVQLVRAICDRVGINYVTELKDSETGRLLGYGLCVDSLHPKSQALFNAEGWHDGVVILDEVEQVIWHLVSANTEVKRRRVEVLQQLRQLLTQVLASDGQGPAKGHRGKVVLSDADLSDISIDFIRGMASSSVEPWICVNDWKPEQPWAVHNYDQKTPIEWLAALEEDIAEGGVPFIVTQGQKVSSKWGSQTLEAHLSQRFPNKRILRIDSETIADSGHPAYGCVTQLNQVLPQYDIVIASPTVETGVSIDIRGHFTGVWGCFQGVLPENTARQSLARVREPVARHIWASGYGIGRVSNGELSLKSLLASENKLAKAHISLLQDASLTLDDEDTLNADTTALTAYGKLVCRINAGMIDYQNSILNGLRGEGHYIIDASVPGAEMLGLGEVITEARDKNYRADCEAVANSRQLEKDEFQKLSQQRSKTCEERQQERKYKLGQRYQVPVTPDLVTKDDAGWYPKLKLQYYLTVGKDYLKARDHKVAESVVQDGKAWLPDFNGSQLGVEIKTLEILGIPQLIDPQREYRATDPDLIQMAALGIAHRRDIKLSLGILIKETDSPIVIAQKLLGKLGLKLNFVRKEGKRGSQQRVYTFIYPNDGRDEVFAVWLERDGAESQNVSSFDTVVTTGIYKNIDSDSDYQTTPDYQNCSHALAETSPSPGYSSKPELQAAGYGHLTVGQRVTVTCSGRYQEKAGRVAEFDADDGTYRIQLDSGGEGWWKPEYLYPEDKEQSPSQPDPRLDADDFEYY